MIVGMYGYTRVPTIDRDMDRANGDSLNASSDRVVLAFLSAVGQTGVAQQHARDFP
jgi:hypothetical protein